MPKTKIEKVNKLLGVSIHKRIRNGETDYLLSKSRIRKGIEVDIYIRYFDYNVKRPVLKSYRTQYEAETAAIFEQ